MTERLTLLFLVAELEKSALQRYTPASSRTTASTVRAAGREAAEKWARGPSALASDHVSASSNVRPRTSNLQQAARHGTLSESGTAGQGGAGRGRAGQGGAGERLGAVDPAGDNFVSRVPEVSRVSK